MKHYNYIFSGTGLAALLTIYEMSLSSYFKEKTILLIDKESKKTNDRTWCFWDETHLFDAIVSKKWDKIAFITSSENKKWSITPYSYKMIKGIDLYEYIFNLIQQNPNITFLKEEVLHIEDLGNQCKVTTKSSTFSSDIVFNSIFKPERVTSQKKYPLLQQHFIGWFIKSKEPVFDSETATFMDFSVKQNNNTRFMYLLPFSKNEALLEYTLFSSELLKKEEYEQEIKNYIQKIGITAYEIIEKEQGNIPMTSFPFWEQNTNNIIHIGSAGGWTKASTGYTFKKAYKKAKNLVQLLQKKEIGFSNQKELTKDKFWYYDLLFIDVLYQNNEIGAQLFSDLFQGDNPKLIFKFLDEETTVLEDLQVIWNCPKIPFLKALLYRLIP
ncbi:lycopene cyclase [Flavobacterium sp. TP390]|uniref:Lycopene cyclase n=1 Tax=Flavobacterium profundi TaxID=1774945 RepID=A0A6I4ISG0_9FLAO|nr:lycopene cyclase family protein [Flavobacterium profundi]MVO09536.1 lycopene cyclase [Flavobacterium profundi]